MTDRAASPVSHSLGPEPLSALRVGRTDVGSASAQLDDDVLTITVRVESEERSLRIRLATIDSARLSGNELELILRDGTRVMLVAAPEFREAILDQCRSLPELTRTLRAFGSSRARTSTPGGRSTDASEQQRFFAPLLEARRAAASVEVTQSMRAFDVAALTAAMEQTLRQFAADHHDQPGPARRALEAELEEIAEPLFERLRALNASATGALAEADDLRLWREWSLQLRMTFEAADRVWIALDAVLDAAHRSAAHLAETAKKRRGRR